MLHANSPVVHGVPRRSDITGSEDVRGAAAQELVDDDPVLDRQASVSRQLVTRRYADSHHDEVALDNVSVGGANALRSNGSHDRLDLGGQVQVDPVLGVQVSVDAADLRPEDTHERDWIRGDDRDLGAQLAGGGGDLGSDPAGADDHDPARREDGRAQSIGLAHLAQVPHPRQVGTWQ